MTTCNKAQANTSRPELRLPDPGHNLPRDGEPLAPPFLASPSCLPSSCLSDSSSFLGFFLSVKTVFHLPMNWVRPDSINNGILG